MFKILNISIFIFLLIAIPVEVFARCAVCYTNGLSGASIALIIILSSLILLFLANKFLHKLLNKNKT